jgi:ATP-dependent Clp protease adaptor protein ClpS
LESHEFAYNSKESEVFSVTDNDRKEISGDTPDRESGVGLVAEPRIKTKRPSLYKVLLLNDDYTPMEFVIEVLEKFFHKDHTDATKIMLNVHNQGKGLCGVYPRDVAETKVALVNEYARRHQHPLQCTLEKA